MDLHFLASSTVLVDVNLVELPAVVLMMQVPVAVARLSSLAQLVVEVVALWTRCSLLVREEPPLFVVLVVRAVLVAHHVNCACAYLRAAGRADRVARVAVRLAVLATCLAEVADQVGSQRWIERLVARRFAERLCRQGLSARRLVGVVLALPAVAERMPWALAVVVASSPIGLLADLAKQLAFLAQTDSLVAVVVGMCSLVAGGVVR